MTTKKLTKKVARMIVTSSHRYFFEERKTEGFRKLTNVHTLIEQQKYIVTYFDIRRQQACNTCNLIRVLRDTGKFPTILEVLHFPVLHSKRDDIVGRSRMRHDVAKWIARIKKDRGHDLRSK